jgi:hypothetical protein
MARVAMDAPPPLPPRQRGLAAMRTVVASAAMLGRFTHQADPGGKEAMQEEAAQPRTVGEGGGGMGSGRQGAGVRMVSSTNDGDARSAAAAIGHATTTVEAARVNTGTGHADPGVNTAKGNANTCAATPRMLGGVPFLDILGRGGEGGAASSSSRRLGRQHASSLAPAPMSAGRVQVLSPQGVWRGCVLVAARRGPPADAIRVHYEGYSSHYDEWIAEPEWAGRVRRAAPVLSRLHGGHAAAAQVAAATEETAQLVAQLRGAELAVSMRARLHGQLLTGGQVEAHVERDVCNGSDPAGSRSAQHTLPVNSDTHPNGHPRGVADRLSSDLDDDDDDDDGGWSRQVLPGLVRRDSAAARRGADPLYCRFWDDDDDDGDDDGDNGGGGGGGGDQAD